MDLDKEESMAYLLQMLETSLQLQININLMDLLYSTSDSHHKISVGTQLEGELEACKINKIMIRIISKT